MEQPLLTRSSSNNASLFTNAGFFSKLTFSWMGALLATGRKKTLELDDVLFLDDRDSVSSILPNFKTNLYDPSIAPPPIHKNFCATGCSSNKVTSIKLVKALVLTTWKLIIVTAFYGLVRTVASYFGPYLIQQFVEYLSRSPQLSRREGYILVLTFVIAQLLEGVSSRHLLFRSQQVGVRVHAALVAIVYHKGLALSSRSRQRNSSGEMINIVSVDAECVANFNWSMHEVWLLPVHVGLALFILYSTLGLAAFAALAATFLAMLANIPLGRMQQNYQEKMMESKDVRMRAMSEILRNMRILKLQGWELKFLSKIIERRKTEMNWLKKYVYSSGILMSIFFGAPTFVAVVTFGTCMLLGIPLESGKVLSALATFRQLQGPIYSLPDTISTIIQTKVSLDRISSFLCLDELPGDAVRKLPAGSSSGAIQISKASFSWDASSHIPTLQDLNVHIQQGMRVAVCGSVGSGKSSLLSSILGEIPKLSGDVETCGRIAYVSQSPWIQSGKVEDNILFGAEMDKERYEKILEACSLKIDLDILPFGDQTIIGERGINLSGGQKQRIQIARALYQDADIFLFDDPFSAVDAHTGSHLFKECLLGLLASKTVVYVTHHVDFLPAADIILVMKDGRITQAGTYTEINDSGEELMEFVASRRDALSTLTNGNSGSSQHPGGNGIGMPMPSEHKDHKNDKSEEKGQLVQEEEREKGKVGFWVYWKYMTMAYGGALVPLILLAQIIFQALQIGSNYWMAWAAPVSEYVKPPVSSLMLISVYVALAIVSSLCILVRSLLLTVAGCKTATILFDKMHQCIFHAPMSFFESTPSGRILNRASTDQSTVDTRIFDLMGYLIYPAIELLGVIVVMAQVAWPVFIIFVPVIVASLWYQQYYIDAARELQRLIGVCNAPIIQHFAESMAGSSIIRSFGKERLFFNSIDSLIDSLSRPSLYNTAAMEWLCFRLDILSSFAFSFVLILLVNLPASVIDPRTAGLAVTYGLSLNMLQGWVIAVLCSLENRMISVERILQYMTLPAEPPLTVSESRVNHQWPSKGEIELRNLHVRYAPQLPFVLKGLTCTFPGGTKTGIVGRTGCGKSTLIQAFFRIMDPSVGQVLIDGIDICTVGLHDLRTRLSIIPQDPTMFERTVRNNLDPLEEYADQQIWEALDCCHLGDEVRKNELKLDSIVAENSENWSVGQRQLVFLGRVILKRSRILVLDEATSSVDPTTDNLIQKTLRQQFPECTVITIAHRITSVLDSDMVLLLDNEHDTPAKLLRDSSSFFSNLVSGYTLSSKVSKVLSSNLGLWIILNSNQGVETRSRSKSHFGPVCGILVKPVRWAADRIVCSCIWVWEPFTSPFACPIVHITLNLAMLVSVECYRFVQYLWTSGTWLPLCFVRRGPLCLMSLVSIEAGRPMSCSCILAMNCCFLFCSYCCLSCG